jgi:ribosomal protein L29
MKGKHTLNNLRKELQTMNMKQKQETLIELQAQLFAERGRAQSHAMGIPHPPSGPHTCRILRKCIAMVKTSMNMKGYGYHPRKGA